MKFDNIKKEESDYFSKIDKDSMSFEIVREGNYENQRVFVKVERSKRRCVSIVINKAAIVRLKIPRVYSIVKAQEFAYSKRDWIFRKVKNFKDNAIGKIEYKTGDKISLLGKEMGISVNSGYLLEEVKVIGSMDSVAPEFFESSESSGSFGSGVDKIEIFCNISKNAGKVFQCWFFKKADSIFRERLAKCFEVFSMKYNHISMPKLRIKRMKSRWGSMSCSGNMSLNCYLVYFDVELIDYVIFHELSHTIEHNHSKNFYLVQKQFVADYKEKSRKLKDNIKIVEKFSDFTLIN